VAGEEEFDELVRILGGVLEEAWEKIESRSGDGEVRQAPRG